LFEAEINNDKEVVILGAHITLGTYHASPYWNPDDNSHDRAHAAGWLMTIRDTEAINEMLIWDCAFGKLILRSLYVKRSWEEMIKSGLIPGLEITIDGMNFTCRVPHRDLDSDICKSLPWDSPYWIYDPKSENISFELNEWDHEVVPILGPDKSYARLVLQPHCPDLSQLVGQKIRLLSHSGTFTAHLLDVTEYDLICSDIKWLSGDVSKDWMLTKENQTYIVRNAILNAAVYEK